MSKSEPKIVEFYEAGKEFEMAKCLPTSRLLSQSNTLTRDLNKMYQLASRHLHVNLHSNSYSIVEVDSVDEGSRVMSSITFSFSDSMDFKALWDVSYFVLAAGYYVLRLYEATFELPKGAWHTNLETFKGSLNNSDAKLQNEFDKEWKC
jgi:hypothetical protein